MARRDAWVSRAVGAAAVALLALLAGCSVRVGRPVPAPAGGGREVFHPRPGGRPYSQAVRVGDTYYLAGKIALTDSTRALGEARAAAETREVLRAFGALLDEMGLSFRDVVQVTVYLADIGDYEEMNRVYAEFLTADPPARETVAVSGIVAGARVEISMIAVRRGAAGRSGR